MLAPCHIIYFRLTAKVCSEVWMKQMDGVPYLRCVSKPFVRCRVVRIILTCFVTLNVVMGYWLELRSRNLLMVNTIPFSGESHPAVIIHTAVKKSWRHGSSKSFSAHPMNRFCSSVSEFISTCHICGAETPGANPSSQKGHTYQVRLVN